MEKYTSQGLSDKEVNERIEKGQVNNYKDHNIKTKKDIILANVCTLFNAVNLFLALIVILTGEFRNMLFMIVIIFNTLIGIYQEIKAKKKLDKLRLLNEPKAKVIRNAQITVIASEMIVKDDLLVLGLGSQILSDSEVIEGEIEVNEALLTGEEETVLKKSGDKLYAGSFIISGNAIAKVTSVGKDNYIYRIIDKAKKEKRQPSRLRDALNFIIKSVSIIILPLGLILFSKQYFISHITLSDAALQTVAAIVGMIPEGLILLTSIALTIGSLKLAKENTLIQELYSLETLARVDVLCLDKTGTITNGQMKVVEYCSFTKIDQNILANIVYKLNDQNATAQALRNYFKITAPLDIETLYPFSSSKKFSGANYQGHDYLIGAYDFMDLNRSADIAKIIKEKASDGYRVLTIAKDKEVIGLLVLEDTLRKNANDTLAFFKKQGVDLKVISGDDPLTVAKICKKAGLAGYEAYVDCHDLNDDKLKEALFTSSIFGRVSPDQKMFMIETLKKAGHTVGMVGDGVNDVMALKAADFSISMYSASDSAKNIANVILLDDDFSHMPSIVNEGRRVINNIQRTATLFLTKTVLSILLSLLTVFILKAYPYAPIQLTLLSSLCIGFPSFILSLEPNYEIVKGNFLANVLSYALPSAISIIIAIIISEIAANLNLIDYEAMGTIITLLSSVIMIFNIYTISKPLSPIRLILIIIAIIGMIIAFTLLKELFYFTSLDIGDIIFVIILSIIEIIMLKITSALNLSSSFAQKLDEYY